MSTRFYSSSSALLLAGGEKATSANGLYHYIELGGVRFANDNEEGVYCTDRGDVLLARSPHVNPLLITRITSRQEVCVALRNFGEYWYNTAHAIVSPMPPKGRFNHLIECEGSCLEDIQELHRRICSGNIRPSSDYCAPQIPPPARHLRQLASEAITIIRQSVREYMRRQGF